MLIPELRHELLQLARFTLNESFVPTGADFIKSNHPELMAHRGVFVTLKRDGQLRGCIGSLISDKSIYDGIQDMARNAAFSDPRFNPVSALEWPFLKIEISVLSEMIPVSTMSEIQIGRDGLLLRKNGRSGVLLPKVAVEWGWAREEFVAQLFQKAGLPGTSWQAGELFRFEADEFGENE